MFLLPIILRVTHFSWTSGAQTLACPTHPQPSGAACQHLASLTVLISIKTREGGAEDFNEVAHAPQVLVHVPEVGVDVVTIPETEEAQH